jgi:hypothetical protein
LWPHSRLHVDGRRARTAARGDGRRTPRRPRRRFNV